jgi:hypothetical protein
MSALGNNEVPGFDPVTDGKREFEIVRMAAVVA